MRTGVQGKLKLLAFSVASFMVFTVSARAKLPDSGCVAFSPRGSLARVVIHPPRLVLRIFSSGSASQAPVVGQLVLSRKEWPCRLSFSADGGLIAVTTYTGAGVQLRVWDRKACKWTATLHPSLPSAYAHDVEAVGFWKTSHNVAFTGSAAGIDGRVAVSVQSLSGSLVKQVQGLPPGFLDPESGYYWVRSSGAPCQLQARTLSGKAKVHLAVVLPPVQGSCLGYQPMFPSGGVLAGANATGSGTVEVWVVHAGTGTPEIASIAKPKKALLSRWADVSVRTTTSPSGNLLAVDRQVTDWSMEDTIQRQRNDLWIYRLAPLALVYHIPARACGRLYAFAIGGVSGHPQLVEDWCGEWHTDPVPMNDKTKQFRGNCIKHAGNSAGIAPGHARQP